MRGEGGPIRPTGRATRVRQVGVEGPRRGPRRHREPAPGRADGPADIAEFAAAGDARGAARPAARRAAGGRLGALPYSPNANSFFAPVPTKVPLPQYTLPSETDGPALHIPPLA